MTITAGKITSKAIVSVEDVVTPAGYKLTELGLIPEDWYATPLGLLVKITSGESPSGFHFKNDGIPYFKVEQLNNNSKYLTDTPYHFRGDKKAPSGSVIFPKRGASILLNKVRILPHDSFMDTNLMALTPSDSLYNEYLYYGLTHIQLWRIADTTSVPQINNKHIKPLLFPIPSSKAEQQAIAIALSDIDSLITSLDQLIAKKSDIKQAAMQQLLTGKQRLPGFDADWVIKKLIEIGTFTKGRGIKKDEVASSGIPCIRYGEIYTHHNDIIKRFYSFISRDIAKESKRLRMGDLLFTGSGETPEDIGKCVAFLGSDETYAGGDIVILSPSVQDSRFLGYLMNHSSISYQKMRMAQGDAIVHISTRNLAQIEIYLPPIDEQKAIANILSDMDTEISTLEQQLDKTRNLKQGMMQELLTGRIRLI